MDTAALKTPTLVSIAQGVLMWGFGRRIGTEGHRALAFTFLFRCHKLTNIEPSYTLQNWLQVHAFIRATGMAVDTAIVLLLG